MQVVPESKDRLHITLAQIHTTAYSPHLAPNNFHLFQALKEFLGGRPFTKKKWKGGVKTWLNGLTAEGYDADIQRLVISCDKCMSVGGHFVGKYVWLCNDTLTLFPFLFDLVFFTGL